MRVIFTFQPDDSPRIAGMRAVVTELPDEE